MWRLYTTTLQVFTLLSRVFVRKTGPALFSWQSHENTAGIWRGRWAWYQATFTCTNPIISNPVPKMHLQVMWAAGAGGLGIKFRFSPSKAQCFNVTLCYIYVKSCIFIPTWKYIRNTHRQKALFIWKSNDFRTLFSNSRGIKIQHKGGMHSCLFRVAVGVTSPSSRSSLHLPDITLSK